MRRNSLLASVAALGLIFTMGSSAALATTAPSGDQSEDAVTTQYLAPPVEDGNVASEEDPEADTGSNDGSDVVEDADTGDHSDGTEEGDQSDVQEDAVEDEADLGEEELPELEALSIAPMSAMAMADIPGLPVGLGYGTIQPDTVFVRGSAGNHDPFVFAGTMALPDVSTIIDYLPIETIRSIVKDRVCGTLPTAIQSTCASLVNGLNPDDLTVDVTPNYVRAELSGPEYRAVDVSFRSAGVGVADVLAFAATNHDFGGPLAPGEYNGAATLVGDVHLSLPDLEIPCVPIPFIGCVPGTGVSYPLGVDVSDTSLIELANTPTLTVVEAPEVTASWDHQVGLRVNGEGYNGIVNGNAGYNGTDNPGFRTDVTLYKLGKLLPVSTQRNVAVGIDGSFSVSYGDLGGGRYFAVPVVSSTKWLPSPVTGDATYLQVLDIRADFTAPTLECLQEIGEYTLSGSVHHNTLPPVTVEVSLDGPEGNNVATDTVPPTRTHFDINANVGAGDYTATFSAQGAKSVTIEGPSVLEGQCATLAKVKFAPSKAFNVCPATTADSTVIGKVVGYEEGYEVDVAVYAVGENEPVAGETNVNVNDRGWFTFAAEGLEAGHYTASVALSYNGEWVETAGADLTVIIKDCGELENVRFDPNPAFNVCPADTANSTLKGKVANYRKGHEVAFGLYQVTDEGDVLVDGYGGDIRVKRNGSFSVELEGLPAGEYYASVSLALRGKHIETVAAPVTVEIDTCAELGETWFTPNPATNVCPATTADTTFTGWVENFDPATTGVVNAAIYTADGEFVTYNPDLPVYTAGDGRGYFNYSVTGLEAGTYYASAALFIDGEQAGDSIASEELVVEISACAELGEAWFTPNPATNVCPATTADTTVTGWVENWNPELGGYVGVGIYADGADEPIAGDGELEIYYDEDNGRGYYIYEVTGLDAGNYYASISLADADGNQIGETISTDVTVEIKDCETTHLESVAFDPANVTNVCPAETADSTLTGTVALPNDDQRVAYALYRATGDEENPWEAVEGHDGELDVDEDGNFSIAVTGLPAGEYSASVSLEDAGEWIETVGAPLTVTITECETAPAMAFSGVAFAPDAVANTCPATTAGSTLQGKVDNYVEGGKVAYAIYAVGNDEPLEGFGGSIDVDEDGNFSVTVEGLTEGEYYASVSLADGDDWIETVGPELTVTIKDCDNGQSGNGGQPGGNGKPGNGGTSKPGGSLPKTGASVGLLLLLGTAAVGGGTFLSRRNK